MAPRLYSRHSFVTAVKDDDEIVRLTEREPFHYQSFRDTRTHVVKKGDTLFTLADRYFSGFSRAAGLWWIIADFQPDPIFDPTIELTPGDILLIPAERVVIERVFSEERRLQETL
jgi:hypothetical protein